MPNTNRERLISYITARIDACLAQNPTVFPSVTSWLRATPGVASDTSSGAPPVVIGWLNQVLQDATKATSEPVAASLGASIVASVKNAGGGMVVIGVPTGVDAADGTGGAAIG
jgi:hypothetical protein